jgi:hypothetical protein
MHIMGKNNKVNHDTPGTLLGWYRGLVFSEGKYLPYALCGMLRSVWSSYSIKRDEVKNNG